MRGTVAAPPALVPLEGLPSHTEPRGSGWNCSSPCSQRTASPLLSLGRGTSGLKVYSPLVRKIVVYQFVSIGPLKQRLSGLSLATAAEAQAVGHELGPREPAPFIRQRQLTAHVRGCTCRREGSQSSHLDQWFL